MNSIMKAVGVGLSLTFSYSVPVMGADRCSGLLHENVDYYDGHFLLNLASTKDYQISNRESKKEDFFASYEGVKVGFDEARSISNLISRKENYYLSKEQSISMLRTTLDAGGVQEYVKCTNGVDISIILPEAAIASNKFRFSVKWSPSNRAEKSRLEVYVTGGILNQEGSIDIEPTDTVSFEVERNADAEMYISATVDGQSDTIVLPPLPKFKPKLHTVDSVTETIIRDGYHGTDLVVRDLCVAASEEGMLLPSTMIWVGQVVGDPKRSYAELSDKSNSVLSCGSIRSSTGAQEISNSIKGHFSIIEVLLEPIQSSIDGQIGTVSPDEYVAKLEVQ